MAWGRWLKFNQFLAWAALLSHHENFQRRQTCSEPEPCLSYWICLWELSKRKASWFSPKIKGQSSFPQQPIPSSYPMPFSVNLIHSLTFILTRSVQHWMHKTSVCWCCLRRTSNKREGLAFILLGRKCLPWEPLSKTTHFIWKHFQFYLC